MAGETFAIIVDIIILVVSLGCWLLKKLAAEESESQEESEVQEESEAPQQEQIKVIKPPSN